MRTSIAGAAFLLVGAGAATVAAVDTTGNNIALNGSDTLFDVTQAVLASCATAFSDFTADAITYQGGGSGVGAGAQGLNTQQIAPSSRAYKNSEYCAIAAPASALASEGLLVGIDGLAVVANPTNSCSSSSANGFGGGVTMAVTTDGTAGGATPPPTCPGCDGSNNYVFANSFDALKVLYFGLHHDGASTYDCASPVRKTLIRQWHNLFTSDCAAGDATCAGGLSHAWRRSDLSGTTDAFVSILNPPAKAGNAVGIGTLSNVPVGATKKMNPFCNTSDANASPPTISFGGSGDFQDLDPVRTNCVAGKDGVCGPSKVGITPNFAGDMGIVLPVLLPDATTALSTDVFPLVQCSGSCTTVAPIRGPNIPSGYKCPSGNAPVLGLCFMPYTGSFDPRCFSVNTNKCVDVVGKPDGRQYNKPVIVLATQIPSGRRGTTPYQFALDANNRIMDGSFYRVHSIHAGANNVPDATVGETGLCNENDDTSQIGCLVDSDPCSVGFAGREGARFYPGTGTPPTPQPGPLKALAINGTPPFTPGLDPDLAVKNLLAAPGTTPLYPMARRLYVNSIYGFGNLIGGERELSQCYANNSIVTAAVTGRFVPVPGGVQCLDFPEELTTTATPAPNVQGTGNVAIGGCGSGTGFTGHNACTDPATAPAICGDGVIAAGFGEQCDPPAGSGSGSCDSNCKLVP
jgi:hypothetical protein